MFDDQVPAALGEEGAFRRGQAHVRMEHGVEKADRGRLDAVFDVVSPQVEEDAQETPEVLAFDRERGGPPGIFRVRLHAGNELHMGEAQVLEKPVDLARELDRVVVDDDQSVGHDPFLEEHAGPGDDGFPRSPSARRPAVAVVDVLGAVERQADEESVLSEEPGPLPVQEKPVRLEAVGRPLPAPVSGLELDGLTEEVEPHQGRLSALPAEVDLAAAVGQGLPDGLLEDLEAHPVDRCFGEDQVLPAVEAVAAGQIAVRAGRLDQQRIEGFPLERYALRHVFWASPDFIIPRKRAGHDCKKKLDFRTDI